MSSDVSICFLFPFSHLCVFLRFLFIFHQVCCLLHRDAESHDSVSESRFRDTARYGHDTVPFPIRPPIRIARTPFCIESRYVSCVSCDTYYHDGSIEPHILRKVVNCVVSSSAQLQRLEISVHGDSCLILPCISSCRALTSLKLYIYPKGRYTSGITLFPKSLNLPALTSLDLTNFAFCASDNAERAEPFSGLTSLNSLIIRRCTVSDAHILSISSATLVNLNMKNNSSDFTKIELSAPSLCTLTFTGIPHQKLCGSSLSSVKHVDIDARAFLSFVNSPLVLFSWLLDLDNIKSLTVTASALQVLSLVPDLLKVKLPFLCNLKSLKVKLEPLSFVASRIFRAAKLKNKSRKEAAKVRKALKAGLEPSEIIPDGMLGFLLRNSPEAKVDIIDYCGSSRKPYSE